MWFKNLTIFTFSEPVEYDLDKLETALEKQRFKPCGSQDLSSYGWVPALGEGANTFAHVCQGYIFLCAKREDKLLPASVINDIMEERSRAFEDQNGRPIRKREAQDMKEALIMELLPRAFSRTQRLYAMISPQDGLLVVDTSASKKAEELTSFLRKAVDTLPIIPLSCKADPRDVMTAWLKGERPIAEGFELGEDCDLTDDGDSKGKISCKSQDLMSDEIQAHINQGKCVAKLSLDWDEQINFVLDDQLGVRRVKYADTLLDRLEENTDDTDALARQDAEFALMGMEFTRLIKDVTHAFGGLA